MIRVTKTWREERDTRKEIYSEIGGRSVSKLNQFLVLMELNGETKETGR